MQTDPQRFLCRHLFTDGRRCGSPSLRGEDFCYYHRTARRPGPRQPQVKTLSDRRSATFTLPNPADLAERSGLQLALGQILHKIAHNEIDPRRAGLLLRGFQIANSALPRDPQRRYQTEPVEEITADPELGALAPPIGFEEEEERQSKSTVIGRILDKLERERLAKKAEEEAQRVAVHNAEVQMLEDARAACDQARLAFAQEREALEAERHALEAAQARASVPRIQAVAATPCRHRPRQTLVTRARNPQHTFPLTPQSSRLDPAREQRPHLDHPTEPNRRQHQENEWSSHDRATRNTASGSLP